MCEEQNWHPEKDISEVTLTDFEWQCEKAFALRESIDQIKDELKKAQGKLEEVQDKIKLTLEQHGKENYRSRAGLVSISHKFSVKVPNEPSDRNVFFMYLRSKGIFEDLITVNSNKLNSFYKAEWEANGMPTDFKMPGIEPHKIYDKINMRKAK